MECKCNRIAHVHGKCNDLSSVSIPHLDFEYDGYLMDVGVGSGDYMEFSVCLDCGKIQDWTPISDEEIKDSEEWALKPSGDEDSSSPSILMANYDLIPGGGSKPDPEINLVLIEKQRVKHLLINAFGDDWMDNAEALEILDNELEAGCSAVRRQAIAELLA